LKVNLTTGTIEYLKIDSTNYRKVDNGKWEIYVPSTTEVSYNTSAWRSYGRFIEAYWLKVDDNIQNLLTALRERMCK